MTVPFFDLRGELTRTLCQNAFKDQPEMIDSVIDGFLKPKADDSDGEEWDEEYTELLAEMAVNDHTNSTELQMLQKNREQKRNQKLMRRKRANKIAADEEKETKAKQRRLKIV